MSASLLSPSSGPSKKKPTTVFINCPYDRQYERFYLALIAGLCGLGLTPRSALEVPGQNRLRKLFELIQSCTFSIHDLSRVTLTRDAPKCPRFNMPFELGLAASLYHLDGGHNFFILEANRRRLQKSLSDVNAFDPFIHENDPLNILKELRNGFHSPNHPTVSQLQMMYVHLKKAAKALKLHNQTTHLFNTSGFKDLVIAATKIREMVMDKRSARK